MSLSTYAPATVFLRAQYYGDPLSLAHFRLLVLCTAGRDQGSFQFELSALYDTTWTQLLLSNAKERLLISGLGSERQCSLFAAAG